MIRQWHNGLLDDIQKNGCALLTVAWYANLYGWTELSPELINYVTLKLMGSGAVSDECYINDWEAVYREFGLGVEYIFGRADPGYECRPGEWEHLHWIDDDGDGHFTAGNGAAIADTRNARRHVTYDPWGESHTVRHGRVVSKRIFREAS